MDAQVCLAHVMLGAGHETSVGTHMDHPLESLFWPRSIAVLGASPDIHRIRGRLLYQLKANEFPGRILPINPSYTEIDGVPCYPTLAAANTPIDLVLMAIPAAGVAAATEDCARTGVKHVVIISSGFAEEGAHAGAVQQQLTEIARRTGIHITGPNCEGFFNIDGKVACTFSPTAEIGTTSTRPQVSTRRIGVIAQSGGIGFALFNRGQAAGLAFSYVISTGNEADLSAADFLDYMVQDPRTDVVMLFLEAVRDGARFVSALERARALGKPIVAVKVGASDAGQRATASHTASLSGWQTAYRAVFARYGVIEADDPDDAVAIAGVLATCPLPKGRRAGVVTVSGGGGAWMADALSAHGLHLPVLSASLQERLRPFMPSYGASANPVDVTAQGSNTGPAVMSALECLAGSHEIDMVVLVTSLASETRVSLDPARLRAVAQHQAKPITVWTYTLPSAYGRAKAAECGLFLHTDLHGSARAMGRLAAYAETLSHPLPKSALTTRRVELPTHLPRVLTEHRAKALLAAYDLPTGPEQLATSDIEAAQIATSIGFPVALKIQSPDIPHKTEAGGVRLHLHDAAAVSVAYRQLLHDVAHARPDAAIDGVLVQRMAPSGHEMVVGMVNNATFGPIMMVGFGGTLVELLGDVAHAPAPLDTNSARRLLDTLRAAPLLHGFRGAPTPDLTALVALIARVADIALLHRDRIREMEFNPVILHADGSGITIADALITLNED
jgi:acetyltransferase